jgi:hypothetical protein
MYIPISSLRFPINYKAIDAMVDIEKSIERTASKIRVPADKLRNVLYGHVFPEPYEMLSSNVITEEIDGIRNDALGYINHNEKFLKKQFSDKKSNWKKKVETAGSLALLTAGAILGGAALYDSIEDTKSGMQDASGYFIHDGVVYCTDIEDDVEPYNQPATKEEAAARVYYAIHRSMDYALQELGLTGALAVGNWGTENEYYFHNVANARSSLNDAAGLYDACMPQNLKSTYDIPKGLRMASIALPEENVIHSENETSWTFNHFPKQVNMINELNCITLTELNKISDRTGIIVPNDKWEFGIDSDGKISIASQPEACDFSKDSEFVKFLYSPPVSVPTNSEVVPPIAEVPAAIQNTVTETKVFSTGEIVAAGIGSGIAGLVGGIILGKRFRKSS